MELDPKTLSQIRAIGGDELLGKLARLYLEHTPSRLKEIRRALAESDFPRTARAIHSLRSSSVTLGAASLARDAAILEQMADKEKREEVLRALPELEKQIRAALQALRKLA